MKESIHPDYHEVTVVCACGESFKTGSTKKGDVIKVDICSKCHPYFTGKQKLVDTGGRVDKFNKRYGKAKQFFCIKGFKGILEGLYDDVPEQAFYMVGTIEDVLQKAEAMKNVAQATNDKYITGF